MAIRTIPGIPNPQNLRGQDLIMNDLKYTEFFNYYCWSKTISKKLRTKPNTEGRFWWRIILPNRVQIYITERLKPKECVVRMNMIYPSAGEIYYLRLLLLHFPARSYDELKTVNHAISPIAHSINSFQESCLLQLLLEDQNEAVRCFEEAMVFCAPKELRNLFVIQTLQGFSTFSIFNDSAKRRAMSLDYIHRFDQGNDSALAFNELLKDISYRLQSDGGRFELI